MAHNYSSLSGEKIIGSIRKQNKHKLVMYILAIPLLCVFLVAAVIGVLKERDQVFIMIFGVVIIVVLMYAAFNAIGKTRQKLADTEHAALFRKFGSPDSIAARIAEESATPLLDSRGTLVCASFIMKHGSFESYIPFDQALLVYRQEHSTNGIKDSVFLVVHDAYGDSVQYQFRMGKKGTEQMQEIMRHISQQNDQCAVGYSQQNLSYARLNAKKVPPPENT